MLFNALCGPTVLICFLFRDRRVWRLRHSLVYLVNNLQYYLQVDVIEAEFSVLKEAVRNVNEFEDIIRLHSKFLSKLLSKTFVMCVDEV